MEVNSLCSWTIESANGETNVLDQRSVASILTPSLTSSLTPSLTSSLTPSFERLFVSSEDTEQVEEQVDEVEIEG